MGNKRNVPNSCYEVCMIIRSGSKIKNYFPSIILLLILIEAANLFQGEEMIIILAI